MFEIAMFVSVMSIDAYYVPRSCLLVMIKHVYESVCGVMCLPYFVTSLGINKNTLLPGLRVIKPLLYD